MIDRLGQLKVHATKDVDDVVRLVYSNVHDTPLIDEIVKKVHETITNKDMESETKETAKTSSSSGLLLSDSDDSTVVSSSQPVRYSTAESTPIPRLVLRTKKRQPARKSTIDQFYETSSSSTSSRRKLDYTKVKIIIPSAKLCYPSLDVNKSSASTITHTSNSCTTSTQRRRETPKKPKVVADTPTIPTTSTQRRKETSKKAKAVTAGTPAIPKRYIFKCSYTSFDKRLSPGRQWTARFQFDKSRYIGGFATRDDASLALEIVHEKLNGSTFHACYSIDEAIRFARDIQSSRDDANRYLDIKVRKTKSIQEGSTSTFSSSLTSNISLWGCDEDFLALLSSCALYATKIFSE